MSVTLEGNRRAEQGRAEKSQSALRTIGEVAEMLGLRPHILRYWEVQFEALRPLKRSGGRRYYRSEDIALLRQINGLVHGQGYTLRGARAALAGGGGAVDAEVSLMTTLAQLRAIRDALAQALDA